MKNIMTKIFRPGLISKYPQINYINKRYKQTKGVYIDDLLDMSTMGIGCNLLGYCNEVVNNSVINAINAGNMSSLIADINIHAAEVLLSLHPEYQYCRFAKTGGEAIQIALATVKKENSKIITCGYNGWHIQNQNYINVDYNTEIIPDCDIFIFEAIRHKQPLSAFIEQIKQLQSKGTIIICDEITSGYRFHFGGAYRKLGILPDIIVYGKCISNGYPMAVILGKEKTMAIGKNKWISSTYWTETIRAILFKHMV
jgi:glutamate-1-semialdehyde aminotransferase